MNESQRLPIVDKNNDKTVPDDAGTVKAPFPMPAEQDASIFGRHIRRTMHLLATSTPEHRNPVTIAFFGQSISKQQWWKDVADHITARFPHADVTVTNLAVGGFAASLLNHAVPQRLFPAYPDLVIFHSYGGDEEFEAVVAHIRKTMSTEVMIHNDHVHSTTDEANEWHDYHGMEWMPEMAEKYRCEMVDVRRAWKQYLADNKLQIEDLLSDVTHLNEQGNFLLAELIKRHFQYNPAHHGEEEDEIVCTYSVGEDVYWEDGRLVLPFEGNRVDVIACDGAACSAEVLIDGKKPSQFPECYVYTLPNYEPGADWPWNAGGIAGIKWNTPPVVEEWTLRFTEINESLDFFRFDVFGSKTGFDGSGVCTETFVSNSGRVVIEPESWYIERPHAINGLEFPVGFEFKWGVRTMFVDRYDPPVITDPSREYATTLAKGLPNERHTLELIADGADKAPIKAVRVYRPPFK